MPWGALPYVTQWTPLPGWQPSSSLPTAQPGHHAPLSLILCPYNHQCQYPPEQPCQNAVSVCVSSSFLNQGLLGHNMNSF
jgi:hypothetical protein